MRSHGRLHLLLAFTVTFALTLLAVAATAAAEDSTEVKLLKAEQKATLQANQESAESRFIGLGFGMGVGLSISLGGDDRIDEAEVDPNGIVRVTRTANTVPRILLETHHFFSLRSREIKTGVRTTTLGHGPFVAIQSSDDALLDSVAFGWLFGIRKPSSDDTGTASFNAGIGMVVDRQVRTLGDGLTENRALPAGETEIRYKDESRYGLLLMSSYTF